MEPLTIFLRTLFLYFFILLIMRLMGKREIGKLSVIDFVVSMMIADMAVIVIEDIRKPLFNGLLPITTLLAIQVLLAYLSLKNERIRHFVDGRPSVLIERGKINEKEMARARYNMDDLLTQLREKNIANIADVEFAILETSGKLSVFPKEEKKPVTREDLNIRPVYSGMPLTLIIDGKVLDRNLEKIDKTRFWLKNEIQKRGIHDFKQITYCSIDHQGTLYIDRKEK
ncbi:DUF421 domain-containing protein [Bacillaceae bacterium]